MQTPRPRALVALVLVAAAAGCGGGGETATAPRLPANAAEPLAARSDAVAQRLEQGDVCGARVEAEALHADAIAAVNAGRVPGRYQEELLSSAATLAASIECVSVPAPAPQSRGGDGEEEDEEEEGG